MALELNGSTQYATLPHETACEFPDGDWTVSAWFYVGSLAGEDRMGLVTMGAWNTASSWLLYMGTDASSNPNEVRCWIYDDAADNDLLNGGTANSVTGTWRAITVRRSGDTVTLWLDGSVIDTEDFASTSVDGVTGTADMLFGMNAGNLGGGLWNGRLADVAKWSRALSDTEIGNLHDAESGVRARDLTTSRDFLYEFDGDATEASGGTTLTLTGAPSTSADGPFAESGTTENLTGTSAGTSSDSATAPSLAVSITGQSAGSSTDSGTDAVAYAIFGTVLDGATPEQGAEVYLIDLSDDSLYGMQETDESGEYRFDGVPAGSYHATVYVSGKTARSQNVTVG